MTWKPGSGRLRFAFSIFLGCLFLTTLVWTLYSPQSSAYLQQHIILLLLILFSVAAGMFAWSMDARSRYLEKEIQRKSEQVHQKNSETKQAEIASAAIYEAARILFSDVHFEGLLEKVMDLISKVVFVDEASLMLFDSKHELYIAASKGIPDAIVRGVHIKIGHRVAGRVAQEQRDYLIVDGIEKYPEFEGIETNARIRSSIVCPLICQHELLGILNINRTTTPENFTVADLMHVSIFCSQLAQAIRNAYLYKALEEKIAELESTNIKLKTLQDNLGPAKSLR